MYEVFYLGSLFCAIITVYLLIFSESAMRSYADYLLSFFYILISWNAVMYLLIYYGTIKYAPYLYKSGALVNFICPVISYLYVRSVLYNEKRASFKDFWHLIPIVLIFINYLPFYMMPIAEKKVIVSDTIKNMDLTYQYNAGIIPEYVTYFLRIIQSLIYVLLQWNLIIRFKKENKVNQILYQIKSVLKWLKIFTWVCTIFVIALLAMMVLIIFNKSVFYNWGLFNFMIGALYASSFLILSTYLLTHPGILAGLPFIKYNEIKSTLFQDETNKSPYIKEDYTKEINLINNYFENVKPFLNNKLTLGQLSVALGIPVRELSYIINNHYNKRFTDFINEYRIRYIIENMNVSNFQNYTIESMALEAGFSSKSGFYKSFKKLYKTTPTDYFQKLSSI